VCLYKHVFISFLFIVIAHLLCELLCMYLCYLLFPTNNNNNNNLNHHCCRQQAMFYQYCLSRDRFGRFDRKPARDGQTDRHEDAFRQQISRLGIDKFSLLKRRFSPCVRMDSWMHGRHWSIYLSVCLSVSNIPILCQNVSIFVGILLSPDIPKFPIILVILLALIDVREFGRALHPAPFDGWSV